MLRPVIEIDEDKCNGCGQCISDCAEGALAIIDGKARLISEVYCDGLGACLNCPQGALKLSMRDAPPFNEEAALLAKSQRERAAAGPQPLSPMTRHSGGGEHALFSSLPSWPVQLELLPAEAAFFKNADLLLAAHCSGFALKNIDEKFIKGRIPVIACPKLQNNEILTRKLDAIIFANPLKSITVLRMSVPCCGGLALMAENAIKKSGKDIPLRTECISLR